LQTIDKRGPGAVGADGIVAKGAATHRTGRLDNRNPTRQQRVQLAIAMCCQERCKPGRSTTYDNEPKHFN
jgi:hypothetical protein